MGVHSIISPTAWMRVEWRNGLGFSDEIWSGEPPLPQVTLNRTPILGNVAFSAYQGFERFLAVISGEVTLTVDGTSRRLEQRRSLRFSGGAVTTAVIGDQSAHVFNVIADQARWRLTGEVVSNAADVPAAEGAMTILHVVEGTVRLNNAQVLDAGSTLIADGAFAFGTPSGWLVMCRLFPAE